MAGTIAEKYISERGTIGGRSAHEKRYVIQDPTDVAEIYTLIAANAPADIDGAPLADIDYEELGEGVYEGIARYETPELVDLTGLGYSLSVSTTGGQVHITHSRATVNTYVKTGDTAGAFSNAIGVRQDGEVEGVDIVIPIFEYQLTKEFSDGDVGANIGTWYARSGTVNSDTVAVPILGNLVAGENLFRGITLDKTGETQTRVTFHCAASPNVTGMTIGDITGIDKKGWEYLWVFYREKADATAKMLTAKPYQVNVEQVYPTATHSDLF